MRQLYDQGYTALDLCEAVRCFRDGNMRRKYVVITFDDGYADFYAHAFPELNRWGYSATVFLPTAYIGTEARQFNGKYCLTWSQVRELQNHGISFGSHTVTHPQLSDLDESAVAAEVTKSKKAIEDNLGQEIHSFSYPFAFPEHKASFVKKLKSLLINSGFRHGVSTRIGVAYQAEDYYFLPRLPMNSLDDIVLFNAKLEGGYDWLYTVQRVSKVARLLLN
jgi:peptidoglycan/xylan/chitin deacetylase (PgdA/CDA1 family)